MDIKTAFLNGEIDEEIYMDQPIGFVAKGQERKVCKLKRSIYGLKQSSRQWYLRFHRAILSNGFTMIEEDHCVYTKRSKGSFIILSLYVDDIFLAGCRHRWKNYFIFTFFFLDTDPHLGSVVCDLYLFSVSRYELCVWGNLCTCVRISTNLESPPTMGNFKV